MVFTVKASLLSVLHCLHVYDNLTVIAAEKEFRFKSCQSQMYNRIRVFITENTVDGKKTDKVGAVQGAARGKGDYPGKSPQVPCLVELSLTEEKLHL